MLPDPQIHFFTWARSEKDLRVQLLLESGRKHGINVKVAPCGSLKEKPSSLLRAISNLPDEDILLTCDGYDVFYLQDAQTIREKFLKFKHDIVFGGEVNFVHHFHEYKEIFDSRYANKRYRYLNSGAYMGYVGAMRKMFETFETWTLEDIEKRCLEEKKSTFYGHFNDQTMCGIYAIEHPNEVCLDPEAELFWNSSLECDNFGEVFQLKDGIVTNKKTRTNPSLLHIPYLRKYYFLFLTVAVDLGLKITSKNFFIRGWDICSFEEQVVPSAREMAILNGVPSFRREMTKRNLIKRYHKMRIKLGRIRRDIFAATSSK